jgi:hypothetical protein
VQSLLDALLLVERISGINLRRHLARHDLQDLTAELHEQVVDSRVDLCIDVLAAMFLAILDSFVDELGVFRLL